MKLRKAAFSVVGQFRLLPSGAFLQPRELRSQRSLIQTIRLEPVIEEYQEFGRIGRSVPDIGRGRGRLRGEVKVQSKGRSGLTSK